MSQRQDERGFTLLELLIVVIVIILLLLVIIFLNTSF